MTQDREPALLLTAWMTALAVSAIRPADPATWFLEAAPVILAIPALLATRRRFPLTPLLYRLIFLHGLILMIGAHYTYAEVPAGFWLQDLLGLARNPYDRIGHLAQGFVPAILAREILLRRTLLIPGRMLFTLVVALALAFSAFYELLEWWAALALGQDADKFLATQGDPWDTQADMFMALIGATAAQLLLRRRHDQELARLPSPAD